VLGFSSACCCFYLEWDVESRNLCSSFDGWTCRHSCNSMQCWSHVVVALGAKHYPRLDGIDWKKKGQRCGPDRHSMDMGRGDCAPGLKNL